MIIIINGKNENVKTDITLEEIIAQLELQNKVMAIAINMKIVKKINWHNYNVCENDKIELLEFVGGG